MLLSDVLSAPDDALVAAERYINAGSPSGFSSVHTVTRRCHPRYGEHRITIPLYAARHPHRVSVIESSRLAKPISNEIERLVGDRIPLHPDVVEMEKNRSWIDKLERVGELLAIPTASGRTVIIESANTRRFHLKLHYNAMLGRYERSLPRRKAQASIDVNEVMLDATSRLDRFAFLPEPRFQCAEGEGIEKGVCAVIRDCAPLPGPSTAPVLLPLFSLISIDERAPSEPLLLSQLLARFASPRGALLEHLLLPLVDAYFALALDFGVILEANAQNVLVELDRDGRVSRLVYRDLQGTYKDRQFLRASAVLHSDYKTLGATTPQALEVTRQQRSYLFDFKLCTYVLAPLIDASGDTRSGDVAAVIRERVLHQFARRGLSAVDYFPEGRTWYGQTPTVWERGARFYEAHQDPAFR